MFYAKVVSVSDEDININGYVYTNLVCSTGAKLNINLLLSVFTEDMFEAGQVLAIKNFVLTSGISKKDERGKIYIRVKEYEKTDLVEIPDPESNTINVSISGIYCPNKLGQMKYKGPARIPYFFGSLRNDNEFNKPWNIQIIGFKRIAKLMLSTERSSIVKINGILQPLWYEERWELKVNDFEVEKGES